MLYFLCLELAKLKSISKIFKFDLSLRRLAYLSSETIQSRPKPAKHAVGSLNIYHLPYSCHGNNSPPEAVPGTVHKFS